MSDYQTESIGALTAPLRVWLRSEVDRASRERLRRLGPLGSGGRAFCRCCNCASQDWTLGCDTCRDRHYKWQRKGRHPRGGDWYQARRAELSALDRRWGRVLSC